MNTRVRWAELPEQVRRLIETETGAFAAEEHLTSGSNCLLGMVMTTEDNDRYFLKGVRDDVRRAVWNQSNEAAINPTVRELSAPLEFHVIAAGWDVLGFRYLADHRHADLSPGSADLPLIADMLEILAATPAPEGVTLRTMSDRFSGYAGDRASLLDGSTLAHTDMQADREAVSALVAGNVVLWEEISTADPVPWTSEVFDAASRWAKHRGL